MGETRKCNGSIFYLFAGGSVIGAVVADCAAGGYFIDGSGRFMSTMHAALTQFVN